MTHRILIFILASSSCSHSISLYMSGVMPHEKCVANGHRDHLWSCSMLCEDELVLTVCNHLLNYKCYVRRHACQMLLAQGLSTTTDSHIRYILKTSSRIVDISCKQTSLVGVSTTPEISKAGERKRNQLTTLSESSRSSRQASSITRSYTHQAD